MRLSIGKRPNPFDDQDMQIDQQSISVEDINNFNNMQFLSKKKIPDDVLNQVRIAATEFNESHLDTKTKLMQNRERMSDAPELSEKIYSCSLWSKHFKLYDPFNDDPEKCNEDGRFELVDEVTFENYYFCSQWNNVACPSCVSKEVFESQIIWMMCYRIDWE